MSKKFDIQNAIRNWPRHDFILSYVEAVTATKKNREFVNQMQVWKEKDGWVYGYGAGVIGVGKQRQPLIGPTSASAAYDIIRRTSLNYFVQEAEELRQNFQVID